MVLNSKKQPACKISMLKNKNSKNLITDYFLPGIYLERLISGFHNIYSRSDPSFVGMTNALHLCHPEERGISMIRENMVFNSKKQPACKISMLKNKNSKNLITHYFWSGIYLERLNSGFHNIYSRSDPSFVPMTSVANF